jgi:hypothetical protein
MNVRKEVIILANSFRDLISWSHGMMESVTKEVHSSHSIQEMKKEKKPIMGVTIFPKSHVCIFTH